MLSGELNKEPSFGASLVVQWLRFRLPMQGVCGFNLWSGSWDPIYHGAKTTNHKTGAMLNFGCNPCRQTVYPGDSFLVFSWSLTPVLFFPNLSCWSCDQVQSCDLPELSLTGQTIPFKTYTCKNQELLTYLFSGILPVFPDESYWVILILLAYIY